jgi:hypothetical protein
MNCEQVQSLFVSYLNHETTPSERLMIQSHLSGCDLCRKETSLLAKTQGRIGPVLQRRAAQVAPASDAWQRLEATLAKEAQPLPSQHILPHLAPGAGHFFNQLFAGGVTMSKRFILTAGVLTLVIAMVVGSIFNNVTPVSAQVVLDKAYAAQASAARPAQGIEHIRTEMYNNYSALPEDQGMNTTIESYHDIESGNFRTVVLDSQTGKVLDVFACDGTYTYSIGARDVSPLTVYRSPQSNVADLKPRNTDIDTKASAKSMFDQLRQDPKVQLAGQETWADGRTVYVLRSQQQLKVMVTDGVERPTGEVLTYFDATTYEIAGYRATMQKDGKELRINSYKLLVNEILPKGTPVAWNLSDLQGKIAIVDDPDRQNGDLLPEIVSEHDLAVKTKTGYLLKTIPDGYSLEISAPPKQSANEPFIYIASYRTPANDYFVIQFTPGANNADSDETYTTSGGLVIHFMRAITDSSGRHFIEAQVDAPDGADFMISSTLPRETVKAWSELLVVVK